jgi:type IV pili sensor histidine kinase/response regulator
MSTLRVALALLIVGLSTCGVCLAAADAVRVARYTEVTGPSAAERDPLAVVAVLRFPREIVATVGDALKYLLQRTGYSLSAGDPQAEHLLSLPLPESQRQLGPHPVQSLAQLLVGEGFSVCADARTRVLTVTAADSANACERE